MQRIVLLLLSMAVFPIFSHGVERAFPPTKVGNFEIKVLPAGRLIEAKADTGDYFENDNQLFGKLFGYIKQNEIAMTVPVEADIDPGTMLFWVGSKDSTKAKEGSESVTVREMPARLVASHGVRGSYTSPNFSKAADALKAWISEDPAFSVAGPANAVFWDGPFTPGFLKRFEVHIPLTPVLTGLAALRGNKRVILYRVEDETLPEIAEAIATHRAAIKDRDLVFIRLGQATPLPFHHSLDKGDLGKWEADLVTDNDANIFLLLGKDGLKKDRKVGSLNLENWFELIDTMPMRQQEMSESQAILKQSSNK